MKHSSSIPRVYDGDGAMKAYGLWVRKTLCFERGRCCLVCVLECISEERVAEICVWGAFYTLA